MVNLNNDLELNLDEFYKLSEDFVKAIRVYPDLAEKKLTEMGNKFREDAVNKTKQKVKVYQDSLIKGYKVGKVTNYNENMSIEFSSTSPYSYDVEYGFEYFNNKGEFVANIPATHLIEDISLRYNTNEMPEATEELVKDIVKECGLD